MIQENTIYVIGIHGTEYNDDSILKVIRRCGVIAGTNSLINHLKLNYDDAPDIKRWLPITPVSQCVESIKHEIEQHSVAVFTSGDPLFYGLGRLLSEKISGRSIVYLPTLSSMQLCFARAGVPWDDAYFLSLHGRAITELDTVLSKRKVFILTDKNNSPTVIAAYILSKLPEKECEDIFIHVGERLGTEAERIVSCPLKDLGTRYFEQPNCVILHKNSPHQQLRSPRFGLREEDIAHSRGLITKNEVRAAVIHALRLPERAVFWDIGAGSGSVSIEVARLYPLVSVQQ